MLLPLRIFPCLVASVACASAATIATPPASEILTFDDLSPPPHLDHPLYDPSDPYRGLRFQRFSVFEPRNRSLGHFLHPFDRNCAVSAPNALLGSAGDAGGSVPSFEVHPDSRDVASFDLLGLAMKPLIAPPGKEEITLWVRGYYANETDTKVLWHVDFPVGWHAPFVPRFPDHWQGLRRVEMWAEYGPTKLDWEFCIDDLRLRWNRNDADDEAEMEL